MWLILCLLRFLSKTITASNKNKNISNCFELEINKDYEFKMNQAGIYFEIKAIFKIMVVIKVYMDFAVNVISY